jgi:prepilin-type processing-associated H-X9-DG protein
MLVDRAYSSGSVNLKWGQCVRSDQTSDLDGIALWHSGGANYAYCDNHVQWLPFKNKPLAADKSWYFDSH